MRLGTKLTTAVFLLGEQWPQWKLCATSTGTTYGPARCLNIKWSFHGGNFYHEYKAVVKPSYFNNGIPILYRWDDIFILRRPPANSCNLASNLPLNCHNYSFTHWLAKTTHPVTYPLTSNTLTRSFTHSISTHSLTLPLLIALSNTSQADSAVTLSAKLSIICGHRTYNLRDRRIPQTRQLWKPDNDKRLTISPVCCMFIRGRLYQRGFS